MSSEPFAKGVFVYLVPERPGATVPTGRVCEDNGGDVVLVLWPTSQRPMATPREKLALDRRGRLL